MIFVCQKVLYLSSSLKILLFLLIILISQKHKIRILYLQSIFVFSILFLLKNMKRFSFKPMSLCSLKNL